MPTQGLGWDQLEPADAREDPRRSSGAPMAYDAATGQVIYFGGHISSSGGFPDETFDWDGSKFDLLITDSRARGLRIPAMAYDPDTTQLVMFGGYNNSGLPQIHGSTRSPRRTTPATGSATTSRAEASLPTGRRTRRSLRLSRRAPTRPTSPNLQFSDSGMEMQGTTADNQFTGIQSVQACQGPFSIDTDALGFQSNGEAFHGRPGLS